MSQVQIARCALSIPDPTKRARFVELLTTADALTYQAAAMRRQAWREYHAAIIEPKHVEPVETGPYA